jgi:glycolate oxidase
VPGEGDSNILKISHDRCGSNLKMKLTDSPLPDHGLDRVTLANELRQVLAADSVLHEDEDLRPYECDGLTAYRKLPLVAVLPNSVDEVQAIMRICHRHGVPVVARGAGTGLSGGALPLENGVLLSLAKVNRILEVDALSRVARVEPGVRNLAISEGVSHLDLYYAPDPSSQIACSIGGNVAENAGGLHCLKYGLTVHNILELQVVTVEGDLITIGSQALDSPGYDLLALMTGSEGMLGVIVEIAVKLLPKPECAKVMLAAFDDVEAAGSAVGRIIADGIIPGGLEMMDNAAIRATDDFVQAGYPTEAAAILLCELDGTEGEVADQLEQVKGLLYDCRATEVRVARDEDERMRFWAGRKAAFPAAGRLSPDYYCMDGTIPRRELPRVLAGMKTMSDEYGLPLMNVFHAGDGNLHPLILYDANRDGEMQRVEELGEKILQLCVDVGGTITGEHGVGIEKINGMCAQFDDSEIVQFHALKRAFDEHGLLNPGKAIPTLQRCAEFGAMHVRGGNIPFPDIERF